MSQPPSIPPPPELVLDHDDVARAIRRIASAIVEQTRGGADIALVGIRGGGVPLCNRIASEIRAQNPGLKVPVGTVEITFYRDDVATAKPNLKAAPSAIDFEVDGRDVVLVDDIIQTGRSVRAALECLLDYGRPRRVWLAVLCDRGGRELPIAADFIGRTVDVPQGGYLEMSLGGPKDGVVLVRPPIPFPG